MPDDPNLSGPAPDNVPVWLWYAMHDLFHERQSIDDEAEADGMREQDPSASVYSWCRLAAELIDSHRRADMLVKDHEA